MTNLKGFTGQPPDQPGLYELACDENDNTPEPIAATTRPLGDLACHGDGYVVVGVCAFNGSITNPQWRHVA